MTCWANTFDNRGTPFALEEIVNSIQSGTFLQEVDHLRSLSGDEYDRNKMLLPAFTLAEFRGTRAASNLLSSEWFIFDADDHNGRNDLPEMRQKISSAPEVGLMFTSCGGKGVKFGCRLSSPITDHQRYSELYAHWHGIFQKRFGLKDLDKKCRDASRICYFSYDADLVFRPSTSLDVGIATSSNRSISGLKKPSANPEDRDKIKAALDELHPDSDYEQWCLVGMALNRWHVVDGLQLWVEWSARGPLFKPGECEKKWKSFSPAKPGGVGTGSVIWMVEQQRENIAAEVAAKAKGVFRDWKAMKENPLPETPWLINNICKERSLLMVTGKAKSKKSFLSAQMALALSTGTPFLGHKVSRQYRTCVLNLEMDEGDYEGRLMNMVKALTIPETSLDKFSVWSSPTYETPTLEELETLAGTNEVFIVDCYYTLVGDENDMQLGKKTVAVLKKIMAKGRTVVLVHHDKRGLSGDQEIVDRGSGTTVLSRAIGTMMSIGKSIDDGFDCIEVDGRSVVNFKPLAVRLENGALVPYGGKKTEMKTSKNRLRKEPPAVSDEKILELLDVGEMSKKEFEKLVDDEFIHSRDKTRELISRLVREGKILACQERKKGGKMMVSKSNLGDLGGSPIPQPSPGLTSNLGGRTIPFRGCPPPTLVTPQFNPGGPDGSSANLNPEPASR